MTVNGETSLAEQRERLCLQLQAQRRIVAEHLVSGAPEHSHYPRSVTMRLLIRKPALVARLVSLIPGVRFAASEPVLFVLACALGSRAFNDSQRSPADRRPGERARVQKRPPLVAARNCR